jgi:ABC-type phosphate transport system substrate-binding protein
MWKLIVVTTLATALVGLVQAQQNVINVHGSGTTNPSKCLWAIMEDFMDQAKLPLHMTYRAVGSSTGIAEFSNNFSATPANDFGSGDLPLPVETYDGLRDAGIQVVQLPFVLSAVSFFHNVPGVEKLDLDACLLARIFNRNITVWGHEDIVARNADLEGSTLPISVARRVFGSSSTASITSVSLLCCVILASPFNPHAQSHLLVSCTEILQLTDSSFSCTQYLSKSCDQYWPADKVGTTIDWPTDTMECEGSGGVTECITSIPGAIGYLDAGHGINEGLQEIELENKAGTVQTSERASELGGIAEALTQAESILPDSALDDWSGVSLIDMEGENTWPIVLLSYIYVREDVTYMQNPEEQTLLKAFLKALYDDDYVGQCVLDHSFTLPPPEIKEFARAAIDNMITNTGAPEWTFESSTQRITGQGPYVISQKRRTHNEVERDDLKGAMEDLLQRTADLESLLQDTETKLMAVEDDSFDKDAMLTVALILAILSFIMCLFMMYCLMSRFKA